MPNRIVNRLNSLLFYSSIAITAMSFGLSVTGDSSILDLILQAIIVFLLIESIFVSISHKNSNIPGSLKIWLFMLFLLGVELLIVPDYAKELFFWNFRTVAIPWVLSFSSYILFKDSQIKIIKGLSIIAPIVGLTAIFIVSNSGGLVIDLIYRHGISKNQFGPFIAIFGVISIYLSIENKNFLYKMILLGVGFACFMCIVVLRARTATIAMLAISCYLLWGQYKWKSIIIATFLFIIVSIFWAEGIETLRFSLFGGRDLNNLDDVTSGRTSRNEESINFFLNHPLWGALTDKDLQSHNIWNETYLIPHLFILWKIVCYGIIGSFPFLVIYATVLISLIKMIRRNLKNAILPVICLLIGFVTSLSEYESPFGPGTSYILCYILYGNYLQRKSSIKLWLTPKDPSTSDDNTSNKIM